MNTNNPNLIDYNNEGDSFSNITLRDLFAGLAMLGGFIVLGITSIAAVNTGLDPITMENNEISKRAYKVAKAMLEERNRENP